jgi:uncharacterized repeat protein (TIGR04076 family)
MKLGTVSDDREEAKDMAAAYDIQVTVVSQKGHCSAEHKEGDKWTVTRKTPAGICAAAFNAFYANLKTMQYGGTFPWGADPDTSFVACPDAKNPVVFELKRLKK